MDRLEQVVRMIRAKRTGPTLDEIIEAAKRGMLSEQDAIDALERDFDESERYRQARETPVGLLIEDELPAESDPETDLLRAEASNLLLRVINALPPRQAQCVELYYLEGFTQQEVAERLGVSRPMVTQHLAAARKKLRESVPADLTFCPSNAVTYRGIFIHDLMADPIRKRKTGHHPMFPFEIWMRWCVGAGWSGNNVYAGRYENRLPAYLAACFDVPPLVGWFTFPRRK